MVEKAPDAFRTISEVAEELDLPQHVLRFWETRFAQIKPMKRSGGRRYYRPDDVDLLKGIRRLLYGEGYTIRGVQRILKEHGIKSVQGLADQTSAVTFGAVEEAIGLSLQEPEEGETPTAAFVLGYIVVWSLIGVIPLIGFLAFRNLSASAADSSSGRLARKALSTSSTVP